MSMDISSSATTTTVGIIHYGGHVQFDYTSILRLKSTSHSSTPLYPSLKMQIQIINPPNLGSLYILPLGGASPYCRVRGTIWLLTHVPACHQLR